MLKSFANLGMEKERLRYLLEQYANDRATWQEVEEMLVCLRLPESEEILQESIEAALKTKTREMPVSQDTWDRMWAVLKTNVNGAS